MHLAVGLENGELGTDQRAISWKPRSKYGVGNDFPEDFDGWIGKMPDHASRNASRFVPNSIFAAERRKHGGAEWLAGGWTAGRLMGGWLGDSQMSG